MAEVVGSISVVASINTKDYDAGKKHIEKGNNDLENSAKKTSSGFSAAWAGAIGGAVASLTTKLMGAVSGLTGEMTDMYDASIKFPKVIQSMGGSTDFAAKSFNTLRKYADDTIYSLEDMTKTFGTLYAVSGDKAGPLVKALGGVSALASNAMQAMDSWSLQLTQMVSKPSVAWVDFRILLEQNPAAIAKIAEAMGKTSSQLVKDVNDGTLSTEDFLKALQNVGNDPALQKMATDSDNFKNATGQLEASVVSAGQKILEKFGPTMVSVINNAADSVKKVSDNFIGVIDWVNKGGTAVDIVKSLAVATGVATTSLLAYNATMKIVGITTAAYAAVSSYLTLVASLQAQGLGILRAAWMGLNIVMSANPIGLVIAAVVALVAGLIWFFTQTETGKKIWADFTKFLGEAITNIGKWFGDLWNGIVATFQGIGQWFGDRVNDIKNFFSGIPGAIGGFFRDAWNRVTEIFGGIGSWFGKIDLAQAGKDMINGLVKGISGAKDAVVNKIKEIASNSLQAIKDFFGIKSPSRVMRDQVGKMIGEGMGIGITKSTKAAVSAASASSRAILDAFDTTAGFSSGLIPGEASGLNGGIVHKGEYVVPKQYVNQSTGLPKIGGGTEYNIQNINISTEVDGDRWLRRLTNNTEIESSGLVPTQRYA